jgi:hypothetical protein
MPCFLPLGVLLRSYESVQTHCNASHNFSDVLVQANKPSHQSTKEIFQDA